MVNVLLLLYLFIRVRSLSLGSGTALGSAIGSILLALTLLILGKLG